MARTKQTARKSTGGRAPRHLLAPRHSILTESKFLDQFGMPVLLWRILSSAGYPADKEPRYTWVEERSEEFALVTVTVRLRSSEGELDLEGWEADGQGHSPWIGANRAAYAIIQDLMDRHPQVLSDTFPGVFPLSDPQYALWKQNAEAPLEPSQGEQAGAPTLPMKAMFAVMEAYDGLETSFDALLEDHSDMKKETEHAKEEYESELAKLRAELTAVKIERDNALRGKVAAERETEYLQEKCVEQDSARRSLDDVLQRVFQERNEAWYEHRRANDRVRELEAYNAVAHEEVHRLQEALRPFLPRGALTGDAESAVAGNFDE